jgi:hypothetical protein
VTLINFLQSKSPAVQRENRGLQKQELKEEKSDKKIRILSPIPCNVLMRCLSRYEDECERISLATGSNHSYII